MVTDITEGSIADLSGIMKGDIILLYALITQGKMEEMQSKLQEVQLQSALHDAARKGKYVILVVSRKSISHV